MLIKSLPIFLFNEENLFNHAHNIKSIIESLPFEETHLSLSQCKELLAVALGFKDLQDLNMHLKTTELSEIPLPPTMSPQLATRILELSKPLPFLQLNPDDYNDSTHADESFNWLGFKPNTKEIKKDLLNQVQDSWKYWQVHLAEFIWLYLLETHNNFSYLESLKLFSITRHNTIFSNLIFANSQLKTDNKVSFLHTAIYNHIFLQITETYIPLYQTKEYENYRKKQSEACVYFISPTLKDYLDKNLDSLSYLKPFQLISNIPLVLRYDNETQLAKLNLHLNQNFYTANNIDCLKSEYQEDNFHPYHVYNDFYVSKDVQELKEQFKLKISIPKKHSDLHSEIDELFPENLVFTEDDLEKCHLYQSDFIFEFNPLKFFFLAESPLISHFNEDGFDFLDHIKTSFSFNKKLDIFLTTHNEPSKRFGVIAKLHLSTSTKATAVFRQTNQNKLSIHFKDIKTQIKRNSRVESSAIALETYAYNLDDPNETFQLSYTNNLHLSHMKLKGFKELADSHPIMGLYKLYIHQHHHPKIAISHLCRVNTNNLINHQPKNSA